jgi:pyruvate dehydrogenase E2 component (dihydrolipoamide acetyltransferase)
MAKKTYKYVGLHTHDLEGGRPVAPGDTLKLEENEVPDDGLWINLEDTKEAEATDAAIKLAKKLDVNLSGVKGSGKDGSITVEDVQAAADAAKEGEEE